MAKMQMRERTLLLELHSACEQLERQEDRIWELEREQRTMLRAEVMKSASSEEADTARLYMEKYLEALDEIDQLREALARNPATTTSEDVPSKSASTVDLPSVQSTRERVRRKKTRRQLRRKDKGVSQPVPFPGIPLHRVPGDVGQASPVSPKSARQVPTSVEPFPGIPLHEVVAAAEAAPRADSSPSLSSPPSLAATVVATSESEPFPGIPLHELPPRDQPFPGIPLHVVLADVSKVFDGNRNKNSRAKKNPAPRIRNARHAKLVALNSFTVGDLKAAHELVEGTKDDGGEEAEAAPLLDDASEDDVTEAGSESAKAPLAPPDSAAAVEERVAALVARTSKMLDAASRLVKRVDNPAKTGRLSELALRVREASDALVAGGRALRETNNDHVNNNNNNNHVDAEHPIRSASSQLKVAIQALLEEAGTLQRALSGEMIVFRASPSPPPTNCSTHDFSHETNERTGAPHAHDDDGSAAPDTFAYL